MFYANEFHQNNFLPMQYNTFLPDKIVIYMKQGKQIEFQQTKRAENRLKVQKILVMKNNAGNLFGVVLRYGKSALFSFHTDVIISCLFQDPDRDLTDKIVMKNPDVFERLCRIVQDTVIYVGDDPSLVKQFVKYLSPKKVLKNEEIIRQGDEGDYFYCIESGKYDVIVNGKKVLELDNKVIHLVDE